MFGADQGSDQAATQVWIPSIPKVASRPIRPTPNRATLYLLYTSLCTGELSAIRQQKCFLCSPFYVKGVPLGYVGRIKT